MDFINECRHGSQVQTESMFWSMIGVYVEVLREEFLHNSSLCQNALVNLYFKTNGLDINIPIFICLHSVHHYLEYYSFLEKREE